MAGKHDGHRERLRNKFITSPDSLEDHELLELLLFYVIPRCNTNETAHDLIARFGSLRGVLDANMSSLVGVKDIGDKTALYLRVVAEVLSRYECAAHDLSGPINYAELGDYLRSLFVGTENEQTFLLLFDSSNRLLLCEKIGEGYSSGNVISMRDIALLSLSNNAAGVVLAHNHPNGRATPSGEDIMATNRLKGLLSSMDIALLEHFVIAGKECVPIIHYDKAHLFNTPSEE
jgi:DNA repair protein RadC